MTTLLSSHPTLFITICCDVNTSDRIYRELSSFPKLRDRVESRLRIKLVQPQKTIGTGGEQESDQVDGDKRDDDWSDCFESVYDGDSNDTAFGIAPTTYIVDVS